MFPTVTLAKPVRRRIELGHPWIYDRALQPLPRSLQAGALVSVRDASGPFAVGYADPASPIRVRVLGVGGELEPGWIRDRARRAAARRAIQPRLADTNAVRAIHGEADGMPGLVIDVYDRTGVAVLDGAGARGLWQGSLRDVIDGLAAGGIAIDRLWMRDGHGHVGDPPAETIAIREGRAVFGVDVRRGQKTGLFLDQRDNRKRVGELAAGTTVLNLFGYTGGFSVHAALAGALHVTTVDMAAPAIASARKNFVLSGVDPSRHSFEVADVFEFLARRADRFDIVVCDPPSFAPSEKARPRALAAYRRLNAAAADAVRPGGLLVTASCSSHVAEPEFVETLASVPRSIRIVELRGAAGDHPVLPAFPEGRYLKLAIAAID